MQPHRLKVRVFAIAMNAILFAATAYGGPARVPNRQPYRVRATATATGRTGSATMSARALIDRDQSVVLEVVAGEFEASTPSSGILTKLQVKTYDGNGDLLQAANHSGIDAPSVVLPMAGIVRGQALQLQSNIRNVDGNRTDVLTVTSVARLRPDLAVRALDVPASARMGSFVHIAATIAELNHDTGARASCLLSVDRAQVDRAEGIWVDGGDQVSCVFTHVFDSGGVHHVRVEVTDVNPGDWDLDNNSATGSLAIVTDSQSFGWATASASSWSMRYLFHHSMFARRAQPAGDWIWTFENVIDRSEDSQGAIYRAHLNGLVQFPLTQVTVEQRADDAVVHQAVYTGFPATVAGPGFTCGRQVDDEDQTTYVEVCSYSSGENPYTSLSYARYAGTVAYFSSHYDAQWYDTPDGIVPIYSYSYNYSDGSPLRGTPWPLGDVYRFDVTLVSGSTVYSRPLSFAVSPMQIFSDVNHPWQCMEFDEPEWGYKRICNEYIDFRTGRSGLINWP